MAAAGVSCARCGAQLPKQEGVGRPRKYCHNPCRRRHVAPSTRERTREWHRRKAEEQRSQPKVCAHCGKTFYGRKRKYCEFACTRAANTARQRRNVTYRGNCEECGGRYETIVPHQRFCSRSCQKRANDRARTQARRALVRGVGVERIDATEVFKRDGWRCQLCGCRTLKSKRGSSHPRAPELDHILPLSRGGSHTWENVQCSCRSCNIAKSDEPMGQLILFSRLAA